MLAPYVMSHEPTSAVNWCNIETNELNLYLNRNRITHYRLMKMLRNKLNLSLYADSSDTVTTLGYLCHTKRPLEINIKALRSFTQLTVQCVFVIKF